MDKEDAGKEEHNQGCTMCNKKLDVIQKKLDKVLLLLPKIKEKLQAKVVKLEKKKNSLKESLDLSQAEIAELKNETALIAMKLAAANNKLAKVDELETWSIKQECHFRWKNIKFFGIQDNDHESPKDAERKLRQFLHKEIKIPSSDLEKIEFERFHRIPMRPKETRSHLGQSSPVSFFQDKEVLRTCLALP